MVSIQVDNGIPFIRMENCVSFSVERRRITYVYTLYNVHVQLVPLIQHAIET